jgi:hypothetical protein
LNDPATTECPGGVDHGLGIDDVLIEYFSTSTNIEEINSPKIELICENSYLYVKSSIDIESVSIYNALGELILKTASKIIDFQKYNSSVYIVKVQTVDGYKKTSKLIIR